LDVKDTLTLSEIPAYYGLTNIRPLTDEFAQLLSPKRFNLILHPKTKGSAREWGIGNFSKLVEILPEQYYKIFITGTREEGRQISSFLRQYGHRLVDLTGRMELSELISFIRAADGLVAASTGPLHIAAALGRFALGLYAPMRPIHAGRWGPVGKYADYLALDKTCNDCRKSGVCDCIKSIEPIDVYRRVKRAMER
jgi:ADP-heptose:LPS heptosyltransferase